MQVGACKRGNECFMDPPSKTPEIGNLFIF
jgi:hypothetical protein